jgi:hypothetical protein
MRPHLARNALLAFPEPGELNWVTVPEVTGQEHDHAGVAAQAVPQVDDQRIGAGEQTHSGCDDVAADRGREQHRLQVEVADVAGQALRAGNASAGLVCPLGERGVFLRVLTGRAHRESLLVIQQPQMLVTVDRLQVGGNG